MPLYDFKCGKSGKKFERFVKLEHFEDTQYCACGCVSSRVISTPMIAPGFTAYDCPITGKWIGSKYEHSENLKIHGCRVYEDGETNQAKQSAAAAEEALDKSIEATVEKTIDSFSSAKKEKLANELAAGADLAYGRI